MEKHKKDRIIFIDLVRAFAVLMMVQGHTVDSLLNDQYRTFDSLAFNFWFFMRGLTAPIFLFSAGTVFTYLLRLNKNPFKENDRVKKGFKRFLLLLGLGYLLRYPTPYLVYFGDVSDLQWKTFFTVDVLHLIAFGLLFTLFCSYIAERFKIRDRIIFPAAAFLFFALYPAVSQIDWASFLPLPIAGYFYQGTGSLFPLFPWVGYVLAGAFLGSYLADNPGIFKTRKFSVSLFSIGLLLIGLAFIGDAFEMAFYGQSTLWTTSPNLIAFRLGLVLIINSIFSVLAIRIEKIPSLVVQIGRNTLPIYVVHLIILYGSAWSVGLYYFFAHSFNVSNTLLTAVLMLTLMITMVQGVQVVKVRIRKRKLAPERT